MTKLEDKLTLHAGLETEGLINFIFKQLPDDVVDKIELDRGSPEGGGVARELVTTPAILTFTSAVAIPIFRLIERWMEQERQERAVTLIYKAGLENPEVVKVLSELEKKHSEMSVKYSGGASRLLSSLKEKASR